MAALPRFVRGGTPDTTDRGRFYTWRGDRYWSVTTIIQGGVPKPALINWAKRFTAEYAVNHMPTLSVLVEDDPVGAVDWLKDAAYRDRDRRGQLGTLVHDAAEAAVLGQPHPPWTPEQAPYMRSWSQWMADFAPTFLAVEATVYSRSQSYAGTLDAIVDVEHQGLALELGVTDRPVRLLIDYKTGSGIYAEVALQLAAYRHADFIGMPDRLTEEAMPVVDGAAAVHLRPDGYSFVRVRADEEMFKAFLYAREVYRFARDLEPNAVGPNILVPPPQLELVQ